MNALLTMLSILPAFCWVWQLSFTIWNLRNWEPLVDCGSALRLMGTDRNLPLVSVLIPARNEESRISRCVESVFSQSDKHVEVIVYNDASTDNTEKVLLGLQRQYPSLVVIEGKTLPSGWFGKPHACWELAQHAKGERLLFLDADVSIAPDTVSRLRTTESVTGAHLISGFGRLTTRRPSTYLLTSLMSFVIALHLPVQKILHSRDKRFTAANGALIWISRTAYEEVNGHQGVSQALVEDMDLARAVKSKQRRVFLANLSDTMVTQMYDSFSDAWNGYKKNIFPGLGLSIPLAIFVLLYYSVLFLIPFCTLLWGSAWGLVSSIILSLFSLVAAIGAKRMVDRKFGFPKSIALGVAVSSLLLVGVLTASMRQHLRGTGYQWKGRSYS